MLRRALTIAALLLGVAAPAAHAADPPYRPGEVVVRYARGVDRAERVATQRATGTWHGASFAPRQRVLRIRPGRSVAATVAALRRHPGVVDAAPNYVAHASFIPTDPGRGAAAGGWQELQWNFLDADGVRAPGAWDNMLRAGRPGGRGTVVAVLDTGVAYADRGSYKRSPDLAGPRFRKGYDFVDHDAYPNDENGHGTHVASTIAESIDNGIGLTGLAYGAKILPIRVLDKHGEGDTADIARGIRFAVRHGAQVINLSFEFGLDVGSRDIPSMLSALRYARAHRVLVVGATGNEGRRKVAFPARSSYVLGVGATTAHGCLAEYTNTGTAMALVAPGGGEDAAVPGDPNCRPQDPPGGDIYQMTFTRGPRTFGFPSGYVGTSMAAPHVSAIAALVIASGVIGSRPTPEAIAARLEATARDLGPAGPDRYYGAGLVDATAATAPGPPAPGPAPTPTPTPTPVPGATPVPTPPPATTPVPH